MPVVTLMTGPDSMFDERFNESVRLLGTIFEESEKAETLIGFIAAERAGIETRTVDIAEEDKPAVYICGLGNWGTTNHLMTAQDYVSFRVANVKNACLRPWSARRAADRGGEDSSRSARTWTP